MSKLNLERDNYVHPGKRISQQGVVLGHGQGMSLRDYFAGQALMGQITSGGSVNEKTCYIMADLLLKEREK